MMSRFFDIIRNLLASLREKLKFTLSYLIRNISVKYKNWLLPFLKRSYLNIINFLRKHFQNFFNSVNKFFNKEKFNLLFQKINHNILYTFPEFYQSFLKKKKNLIISISIIVVFILWGELFSIFYTRNTWEGVKTKKVVLQNGMTLDDISKLLTEKNIISNRTEFKLAVKILGKENQLFAGTYYVRKGLNNIQLTNLFTSPDYLSLGAKGKVTFPEGYRIKQMASMLQKEFNMSYDNFIKETENDSLINLIGLKGKIKNLEGFLFPDTYIVPIDAKEKQMVKILFDNFLSQVYYNQEIQEYTEENPQKLLNLITLASIVQAETAVPEEYPIIAGVYINRLRKNIKLQADPTVQYILPDGPRRLLNKDYKIESPYNTYIHYGLPPGPINNPGLEAIKACMKPAEHDYYFFVAKKDKTHKFSKTYEEHLQAINEIRGNQ